MLVFLAILLTAPEPLDLTGAEVVATHATNGTMPALILDGDEATEWIGAGHDLRMLPTNLVITLPEPHAVGSLKVVTNDLKGFVRLRDLEVYGRAGTDGDWSPLGGVQGNESVRFTLLLQAATVRQLRLRILDTGRPDHAWPRIHEVRLLPPEGTPLDLPKGKVPDESKVEQLYLEAALGHRDPVPETPYDPELGYLYYLRSCCDTLMTDGTDQYGEVKQPIFMSILGTTDHAHPNLAIPPIEGQRQGDRALFGGNLQHDLPLLLAMRTMGGAYEAGAQAYLSAFLKNCTHTATGLWPWGEHAHWQVYEDQPGHNTHEYLGAAPINFWDWAWSIDPEAVKREADGLINHIYRLSDFAYNRHADLAHPLPTPRKDPGDGYLDFPRHGGFYMQVWSYAFSKTHDPKYLDWADRMMDHHVAARHPATQLIPSTTTRDKASFSAQTILSLSVSMLESVPLLGQTPEAERCNRLAREYLDTLLSLPHKPTESLFVTGGPVAGLADPPKLASPGYTEQYGGGDFLGTTGHLYARAYRLTKDPRCLAMAKGIAVWYRDNPAPDLPHLRASVYGKALQLMLEMDDLTGEDGWLPAAEGFARAAIGKLHDNGLFRGASKLWYYDSELGVGTLGYGLVRLQARLDGEPGGAEPICFER